MAKPVYIIVAESISEDKTTNLVSLFTVCERWVLYRIPEGDDQPPTDVDVSTKHLLQCVVVAVWMHEEGDEEREYTHQFFVTSQSGTTHEIGDPYPFRFSGKRQFQRFRLNFKGATQFEQGQVTFGSRIRSGDSDWITQTYTVRVDIAASEESPETGQ